MELTCIVCPKGCRISIEKENNNFIVVGNSCPRGERYAISEMKHPMRMLTSTITVLDGVHPVCPIISSQPIPKEKIPVCMKVIWQSKAVAPIACGDVVISNIAGTKIDMLASRDLSKVNNE